MSCGSREDENILFLILSLSINFLSVLNCLIKSTAPRLHRDDCISGNILVCEDLSHSSKISFQQPGDTKNVLFLSSSSGSVIIKACDAKDFITHWNPHESKQFFWVDDAFGATQIDWSSTYAWNRMFPHVQAAISKGSKILFTSRDYIYKAAKDSLKESALPVMRESQVVINVQNITTQLKFRSSFSTM